MRKKLLGGSLLVILAALVAYGTAAYFTAETRATNVITTGTIDISLEEYTKDSDDQWVSWPEDGIKGVMPGASVDKLVTVKNEGTSDAWVRVIVDAEIIGADGKELPIALENAGEHTGEPALTMEVQKGWVEGEDEPGVYYFTAPVAPKGHTLTAFTKVDFNPAMDNKYQGCTANVYVQAQAVQVKNNGETVMDAEGWPALDTDLSPEHPIVLPEQPKD